MKHRDIHMKLSDIITTQQNRHRIEGKHRQPISCNSWPMLKRYRILMFRCVNCGGATEKNRGEYEPMGNISEHVCDGYRNILSAQLRRRTVATIA